MSNLRWHVQTIAVPSSDTNTSLLVNFENDKYLFECPESTSRAFIQNKVSGKKVAAIFLSTLDQETSGGLFGALLGLRENGAKQVDIYGPPGLEHFLASGRYFTRRDNFTVRCHPVTPQSAEPMLRSKALTVYGFPISSSASAETCSKKRKRVNSNQSEDSAAPPAAAECPPTSSQEWCTQVINDMFRGPDYRRSRSPGLDGKPTPSPAWDLRPLPPPESPACLPGTSVAWLGVGPPIRGRFLVQRAKELGVTPGKDFGLLANGQPVTVGDRVVQPEECLEQGQKPGAFVILRVSESQLADLSSVHSKIKAALDREQAQLKACYHLVDRSVLKDPAYQSWIREHDKIEHYVAHRDFCPDQITFAPAMLLQLRLSRLDPSIFAVPNYSLQPSASLSTVLDLPSTVAPLTPDTSVSGTSAPPPSAAVNRRTFPYELGSAEALQEEALLKMESASPESAAIQQRAKEAWRDYLGLVDTAKTSVVEKEKELEREAQVGDHLLVTTTGTGSASPSKYRNVSSTLLEDPETGFSCLLDAGEGTWGQLVRRFTRSKASTLLGSLSCVFVSHMHGDHHAGLAALLARRAESETQSRLVIVCPPNCRTYLLDLSWHQDLGLSTVDFVDPNELLRAKSPEDEALQKLCDRYKLKNISTTLVDHRARCFGLQVTSLSGWKVVFSGDTRPCQSLVALGKDATLLIHEATIDDSMPEVARKKGHSTFGEALQVAKSMRARTCLLTHFSQRYPKLPPVADDTRYSGQVGIAFDGMRIAVGDMWKMTVWRGALEALFRETSDPEESSSEMQIDDDIE